MRPGGSLLAGRRLVTGRLGGGRDRGGVLDKFKVTDFGALELKEIVFDSGINE